MRHFTLLFFGFLLVSLFCFPAASAELSYNDIDRATVRVLALGQVDVEVVEHEDVKYPVAIPLAGHGSGVLISEDGLILTAQHVVADSRSVAVMISGFPKALPAVVVFENPNSDVALIRVLGSYTQFAKLADASAPIAVRQAVFAIGYPLDAKRTDPQSTQGIISGLLPDGSLQLGMSVNPGNSGGPVVDETGLVRGIVVARSRLDQGAVGLAYAVPVDKFTGPVNLHHSRPLTAEQTKYLRSDSAQRSASLTQLMSQYGLEVLEASLSGGKLDVEPTLQRSLDESSEGVHASVDGRLMSGALYWNRALVEKVRGDGLWLDDQRRAVQLAKQAAAIEPALRKESRFIQIALNVDGRWNEFTPALGNPEVPTTTGGDVPKDAQNAGGSEQSAQDAKRLKTAGFFAGVGVGSITLSQSGDEFTTTEVRLGLGYWSEPKTWLRAEIGGLYRTDNGGRLGCDSADYDCETRSVTTHGYGVGGSATFVRFARVGINTEYVSISGSEGDSDGMVFEGIAGLRIPTEPVDVGFDAFYSIGRIHSTGWYASINFRL